jgi:putative nucleotidyltransferase with HDIG domain
MQDRTEQTAFAIIRRLRDHGYTAYYAGGYVRDMLLGTSERGDIDIATDASPRTVADLFHHTVGVGEAFGVMLVMEAGIAFEVATFRTDIGASDGRHPDAIAATDARTDALRRDFTINGLFFDPLDRGVLDFVGGREDLAAGIIRAIGDPAQRFEEDYLRLLRAIRFAARFGFAIEAYTWAALRAAVAGIERISRERVFQELDKMLRGPAPHRALRLLDEAGLLGIVLPEVKALAGVPQPAQFHPEGDVLVHTELALSHLNNPSPVTAWSTLLHDIGKPATMTLQDRIRFNNHHRVGATMAAGVLRRLKSSRALMEAVCACVDNHMNFMNVKRMRLATLKQFLARPTIEDEIELHRVDCLASHGDLENVTFLREMQHKFAAADLRPPPLLQGKDLLAMGFKPGPLFGRILRAVYDLQLDEKLATAQEARDWVGAHRAEFDQESPSRKQPRRSA